MTTSDQTRDHTHDSSATQEGPVAAAACAAVPARVGDFEIVARLGQGAFAQVFLARQVSLGRAVALKLSAREPAGCDEGRLLASLEHDHIVKVFAAFADPDTGLRGLCLQYVPGADLGAIIRHLHAHGPPAGGAAILAALDELRHGDPGFDPAALRDREALAASDFPQAVCLLGAKLAEALAFAQARGVLHCDIKPGNILLTPYGRPLLADFNVAFARAKHDPASGRYGGTLAYMAPEYRAAVMGNPGGAADERCDLFSLGVVLHELATGARPAPAGPSPESEETLMPGAAPAGRLPPRPLDAPATLPRELAAVIRRALDPDPAARYQTAADLAAALSGARQLLALRRSLPP
ncbi:MAG: serine/threonine-protein kinase, partial [Gemmata sp.]